MGKRILIVDDDPNIVRLLGMYLTDAEYETAVAADGSQAMDRFHEFAPDLILLDVMMPVINGWEVLSLIRQESQVPVIMLTSRDMVDDKVRGFTGGADDYVVKPFEPREVLARIAVRLKKQAVEAVEDTHNSDIARCGTLVVDLGRYEVLQNGKICALKPREIQLLHFLMRHRNLVFSRDQLLERVWDYDVLVDTRTVDAHMKRLRQVLQPEPAWNLKTVWGVGYKFEAKS
jgi:DNA-binding response OmpR family regulator